MVVKAQGVIQQLWRSWLKNKKTSLGKICKLNLSYTAQEIIQLYALLYLHLKKKKGQKT